MSRLIGHVVCIYTLLYVSLSRIFDSLSKLYLCLADQDVLVIGEKTRYAGQHQTTDCVWSQYLLIRAVLLQNRMRIFYHQLYRLDCNINRSHLMSTIRLMHLCGHLYVRWRNDLRCHGNDFPNQFAGYSEVTVQRVVSTCSKHHHVNRPIFGRTMWNDETWYIGRKHEDVILSTVYKVSYINYISICSSWFNTMASLSPHSSNAYRGVHPGLNWHSLRRLKSWGKVFSEIEDNWTVPNLGEVWAN